MGWFTPKKTSDNELGDYLPDDEAQPISEQIERNWSGMSGIANRGGYCKHIIRVIVELGLQEEWGIPSDLPTPGMWRPTTASDRPLMNPNSRLGDRFDEGIGF